MNTHYLNGLPTEWEATAQVFAALGDGTRQTILLLFEPGEAIELKTLVDSLPLSRTATVHHLKTLEQAGLLAPLKHGRSLSYTLNAARLVEALDRVRDYAGAYLTAAGAGQRPPSKTANPPPFPRRGTPRDSPASGTPHSPAARVPQRGTPLPPNGPFRRVRAFLRLRRRCSPARMGLSPGGRDVIGVPYASPGARGPSRRRPFRRAPLPEPLPGGRGLLPGFSFRRGLWLGGLRRDGRPRRGCGVAVRLPNGWPSRRRRKAIPFAATPPNRSPCGHGVTCRASVQRQQPWPFRLRRRRNPVR